MADDKSAEGPDDETAPEHHEGLGGKLHRAEHAVEQSFKDTVARVENRIIVAGEAETSASPEVNLASALEVVINPPHADESDDSDDQAATDKAGADPADSPDVPSG
ncbi:MAG: hypothetical protein WAT58_07385 [Candidatus Dormiibacterota bacterium]